MNPAEILRIVDAIHLDKNIDKEIVFEGIEAALVAAAKKHYGEEEDIVVDIDRVTGAIDAKHNGEPLDSEETVGRIGAQSAKQVMIQKIREAERDALLEEYKDQVGQMVTGLIQRYDKGTAVVQLHNSESILPRSEQIPGESHHVGERVRATIFEVRIERNRVKIILSRRQPQLVQRLFEQEIPEIVDGVIEVRALAREPGYRSKVAVTSSDTRIDCVGACVGVRGNRIKNIIDELAGEKIDIIRWNDDLQVLIPNALQPSEVDEVILCQMLGRAIVLVREDQLSLAIGRRGQNVRLASRLCGWDIEIMTREELDQQLEQAIVGFCSIEGVTEEISDRLVAEGFLTYDDLSIIEPDALMEMGNLTEEQVDAIVEEAEARAEEAERIAAEEKRRQKEAEAIAAAEAEAAAAAGLTTEGESAPAAEPSGETAEVAENASGGEAAPSTETAASEPNEAESPPEEAAAGETADSGETADAEGGEASSEEGTSTEEAKP